MIDIDTGKLDEQALKRLITDGVAEAKHIEYKRDFPTDQRESKLEFLRDVSSFANAEGGLLFFGVSEEAGVPKDLPGLDTAEVDRGILRLESMLRDNVDPRVDRVQSIPVALSNGRRVVVMRIPKSWRAPHMIVMDGRDNAQFYTRASNGKHRMDLTELRSVLAGSLSRSAQLREFRNQRLWRILARELPEPLQEGPVVAVHLLPASITEPLRQLDVLAFPTTSEAQQALAPYYGDTARFCLDGFIVAGGAGKGDRWRYLLAFRSGAIELVRRHDAYDDRGLKRLPGNYIEGLMREDIEAALEILCRASVQPPMFVSLSLLSRGSRGSRDTSQFSAYQARFRDEMPHLYVMGRRNGAMTEPLPGRRAGGSPVFGSRLTGNSANRFDIPIPAATMSAMRYRVRPGLMRPRASAVSGE